MSKKDVIRTPKTALVIISGVKREDVSPAHITHAQQIIKGKIDQGDRHGTVQLKKVRFDFVLVPPESMFSFVGDQAEEYARNFGR